MIETKRYGPWHIAQHSNIRVRAAHSICYYCYCHIILLLSVCLFCLVCRGADRLEYGSICFFSPLFHLRSYIYIYVYTQHSQLASNCFVLAARNLKHMHLHLFKAITGDSLRYRKGVILFIYIYSYLYIYKCVCCSFS